jgi:hypothetical protein
VREAAFKLAPALNYTAGAENVSPVKHWALKPSLRQPPTLGRPNLSGSMSGSRHRQKFQVLARKVEPRSRLLRTGELAGGVSADVTAFEIEIADGRTERLVVRRHGAWI